MRMWHVNPKVMCRQHLLGEHVEMHMFVGTIAKGVSIKGYAEQGLVDTRLIQARHDCLAAEIEQRGYDHHSPMLYQDSLAAGAVDMRLSEAELLKRCPECRARYQQLQAKRRARKTRVISPV